VSYAVGAMYVRDVFHNDSKDSVNNALSLRTQITPVQYLHKLAQRNLTFKSLKSHIQADFLKTKLGCKLNSYT